MDELTKYMNTALNITDNMSGVPEIKNTVLDIDITVHEQISRPLWADFDLPVEQFPVLPLEVVNYYCRTHFDDEDFIYVQFELPLAIQNIIAQSGYVDVISYMRQTLTEMIDNPDVEYAQHVIDVYTRIIGLYDKVLDYNMTIEAEMEPDAELWPDTYLSDVYSVCNTISSKCVLDMYDPMYKNTMPYYREIYYGLGLVIYQLTMICDYYLNKQGITSPVHFLKRHRDRFMRLVNNLCIIMIHNNFMWGQTDVIDMEAENNPFESHDPDASWQLKYPRE